MPGNGLPRRCSICNQEKPGTLEFFYAHPTANVGLDPRCKVCQRAASRRSRERHSDEEAVVDRPPAHVPSIEAGDRPLIDEPRVE